jgi:hypothetical protein
MLLDLLILVPAVLFTGACVAEAILEVYEGAIRRWTRYKLRKQSVKTEPHRPLPSRLRTHVAQSSADRSAVAYHARACVSNANWRRPI